MTAQNVEAALLRHAAGLATVDASIRGLREGLSDSIRARDLQIRQLQGSIERKTAGLAAMSTRIALLENNASALTLAIERGRSNRWALVASLITALVSLIGSAAIALYLKPK